MYGETAPRMTSVGVTLAEAIELWRELRRRAGRWRAPARGRGDAVFVNRAGGRRTIVDVQRPSARRANGPPVTQAGAVVFHSLRHTGISRAANHPAIPLVHVREFARHADLATTQSYVHKIENEKVTTALGEALAG